MNNTHYITFGITLAGVLAFGISSAQAGTITTTTDTFGSGVNAFTIDFVNVGNAGNGDDLGAGGGNFSSPYGGVGYVYRVGTYEISQTVIAKAIAAGLINVPAASNPGNKPVGDLSWYKAAAFVNWLNTTTGHHAAYQLDAGATALTLWNPTEAWLADGLNLFRHKDAYYFLPSEDEWYKAAFHKNDGVTANYWDFATGSNQMPTFVESGTAPGTIVVNHVNTHYGLADVNMAGGLSPYGSMAQNGNGWEFVESAFTAPNDVPSENRVRRGGGLDQFGLTPAERFADSPAFSFGTFGFRVASAEVGTGIGPGGNVPEPSTALLLLGSGWMWLLKRRRRPGL